jgi:hypothetical protein
VCLTLFDAWNYWSSHYRVWNLNYPILWQLVDPLLSLLCCGLFNSHGLETLQFLKWGLLQVIPYIREPCILCVTLPGVSPVMLKMVLNVESAIPNLVASATHFLYYHSLRLECQFSVRRDFPLVKFTHQTNQNQEFSKSVWWFNSR